MNKSSIVWWLLLCLLFLFMFLFSFLIIFYTFFKLLSTYRVSFRVIIWSCNSSSMFVFSAFIFFCWILKFFLYSLFTYICLFTAFDICWPIFFLFIPLTIISFYKIDYVCYRKWFFGIWKQKRYIFATALRNADCRNS